MDAPELRFDQGGATVFLEAAYPPVWALNGHGNILDLCISQLCSEEQRFRVHVHIHAEGFDAALQQRCHRVTLIAQLQLKLVHNKPELENRALVAT
jgi:hypothetical protein